MRLTMSEPDTAKNSTIGCSVKPAITTFPNQSDSAQCALPGRREHQHDQQQRRRDRRALEVLHLAALDSASAVML